VRVLGIVSKIAPSQSTVLIYGPTGTGKELIAGLCGMRTLRVDVRFIAAMHRVCRRWLR
jgi:transcriptional regulator with GAF, ATPase, and Fis domain